MTITRFRAYQLGEPGSSFSYCHDGRFTLIEARITNKSYKNVNREVQSFASGNLNTLHITSWDNDHCRPEELQLIIDYLRPMKIEYPGYDPESDSSKEALSIVKTFHNKGFKITQFTPAFIGSLENAKRLGTTDILYWPLELSLTNPNDNSSAKLFRSGHFTVLSLGDLESFEISKNIMNREVIKSEVDIMILAHHGADNGFTCQKLLDAIKPTVAICTSNYDSQYNHPKENIRTLLFKNNIPLFTTKTGDVIIQNSPEDPGKYEIFNLIADSSQISTRKIFNAKSILN